MRLAERACSRAFSILLTLMCCCMVTACRRADEPQSGGMESGIIPYFNVTKDVGLGQEFFLDPGNRSIHLMRAIQAALKKANSNEPLDVRGLMVAEGINFPPGAEAFFNPATGQVWMRNTRENRRLAEWFLEVVMKEVRVDVRAIEIEQNRAAIYSEALSFAELEKRLGHAPVVFAGATVVTKSQQRVVGNHREGDEATASKPKTATEDKTKIEDSDWPPPRDVRRTFLEAEPTIGPDGVTVDCQFKFKHAEPARGARKSFRVEIDNNLTLRDGSMIVAHRFAIPDAGGAGEQVKHCAILVEVTLVTDEGILVRSLEKMWREQHKK